MSGKAGESGRTSLIDDLRALQRAERRALHALRQFTARMRGSMESRQPLLWHIDRCEEHDQSLSLMLRHLEATSSLASMALAPFSDLRQRFGRAGRSKEPLANLAGAAAIQAEKITRYRIAIERARAIEDVGLITELDILLREDEAMADWLQKRLPALARSQLGIEIDERSTDVGPRPGSNVYNLANAMGEPAGRRTAAR